MPICTGFERILRYDQICYEYNPKSVIMGEDIRHGLHLIVDDNQDMMMKTSSDTSEDLEDDQSHMFEYQKDDEKEGIKLYLDSIGNVKVYKELH